MELIARPIIDQLVNEPNKWKYAQQFWSPVRVLNEEEMVIVTASLISTTHKMMDYCKGCGYAEEPVPLNNS